MEGVKNLYLEDNLKYVNNTNGKSSVKSSLLSQGLNSETLLK